MWPCRFIDCNKMYHSDAEAGHVQGQEGVWEVSVPSAQYAVNCKLLQSTTQPTKAAMWEFPVDLVLSLLWCGFDPWPRNGYMQKKKQKAAVHPEVALRVCSCPRLACEDLFFSTQGQGAAPPSSPGPLLFFVFFCLGPHPWHM